MKKIELPPYPVQRDMWDRLSEERRPIVIYGMGNGADKLIARFEKYGIKYADIFASDGFVRGHSFHGMRVKSFTEIRESYPEFVIALSFASNRTEVLSMLKDIDEGYEMLVPDMPVAGEEYFDKDFYNKNYESISRVYGMLADDTSRAIYASVVWYKLTGEAKYLFDSCVNTDEIYSLIGESPQTVADLGAYNGDTVREAIKYFPGLKKIYAFEPDKRNYKKLERFSLESGCDAELVTVRAALWDKSGDGVFIGSGNRNSSVSSTSSFKNREEQVPLMRLDEAISERVDYIKYDVEGAEREALIGSRGLLEKYRPTLLVSLYHRSEDIFSLPELIAENYKSYKLYVRRTLCLPAWEIALIAVPE